LPNKCEALSSNPSTAKNCDKKETTFILIYWLIYYHILPFYHKTQQNECCATRVAQAVTVDIHRGSNFIQEIVIPHSRKLQLVVSVIRDGIRHTDADWTRECNVLMLSSH
jgi:hypothetical protein